MGEGQQKQIRRIVAPHLSGVHTNINNIDNQFIVNKAIIKSDNYTKPIINN